MTEQKIDIGVVAPSLQIIMRDYSTVDEDPRFHLSMVNHSWSVLQTNLKESGEPQLLIVYAETAPDPDSLVQMLGVLRNAVAIVLLPASWTNLTGSLEKIHSVKKVLPEPVVVREVLNMGYALIQTAQAMSSSVAPLQAASMGRTQAAAYGTRVIAFLSAQGGTGRTTIAESLARHLSDSLAIRTLLCGFDLPSPIPLHLGMNYAPNAAEFFARPNRSGFAASLQKRDNLELLLSPQESIPYAEAAERSMRASAREASAADLAASIRGLVSAALPEQYASILLDLPAGEGPWTYHAMTIAHTLLVVAPPTMDGVKAVGHVSKILTSMLSSEHQFQKNTIFVVLNKRTSKSRLTPAAFSKGGAEHFDFFPPVLATIDFDEAIPGAQDDQRPAIQVSDTLAKGVAALAEAFWPGMGVAKSHAKRKGVNILGVRFESEEAR